MRIKIDEAVERLKEEVVAIPTETVYGLAASIHQPLAIQKIYTLKNRPRQNPLIIHLSSIEEVKEWAEDFPPHYEKLAALWPGPLTLILKAKVDKIPKNVRSDLPTAAFRVPALPLTRELLRRTGPLVVPSANLSGRPSSTEPRHVEDDFGLAFPVLDGGPCQKGLESTILSYSDGLWKILRQGALPQEYFEPLLGYLPAISTLTNSDKPECPGQLFRHYAPKATLMTEGVAEVTLGFNERSYSGETLYMGSLQNPGEVAHHLYFVLRELDEKGFNSALVDMDFPQDGLWRTVRERLLKASEPPR